MIGLRQALPGEMVAALARCGVLSGTIGAALSVDTRASAAFADQMEAMANEARLGSLTTSRAKLSARYPGVVPLLRLPTASEIAAVDLAGASGLEVGARWRESVADEIEAITTPWVRDDRPDLSIEGYAAFRGLTEAATLSPLYGPEVADLARARLGDYREPADGESELDDPMLVTGLRWARGFDQRLSTLPAALAGALFQPFGLTSGQLPEPDEDELEDLVSSYIRRLEKRLRSFIDDRMTATVGPNWIRQRVHERTRGDWEGRRLSDVAAGRPSAALLDYASFREYADIIGRGDNWRECFEPVFRSRQSVLETLSRLATVRNPSAHVRPLVTEDVLILRVEGLRLHRWMDARAR